MVHSEAMFFEIMCLYAIFTDYVELELDLLKDAFYELQDLINDNIKTIDYDFEEELDNLVTKYGSVFELTEDTLIIQSDIDEAYVLLDQKIDGGFTEYDDYISMLVQNIKIYHSLDIQDPTNQYIPFWQLNSFIVANHFLLAQKENMGAKIEKKDLCLLSVCERQFQDMISEISGKDDMLIRASLEFQNEKHSLDPDWYVALFAREPLKSKALNHSLVSYHLDPCFEKIKMDNSNLDDNYYTCYTDRDYFLIYFITVLENLLPKLYSNGEINKILNTRKHLLIAITPPLEKEFIEHGEIKGILKPLDKSDNSKQAFLIFYPVVLERINKLNCPDIRLDANKISDMILSAIFIRTFLDTCLNEDALQDVYYQVKKASFLNNPNYYYATLFTELIILSGNEPDIEKKR